MNLDKLWDVLINKAHIAIVTACQGAILVAHWRFGKDLSPSVAQTVNWFYMAVAGHFVGSQIWPDKKQDQD